MINRFFIVCLMLMTGSAQDTPIPQSDQVASEKKKVSNSHPRVDYKHWSEIFPIQTFERTSGPRKFSSTPKDDPLDLWKPHGEIITSPSHLCNVELVRQKYAKTKQLGPLVPVDLILWSSEPAEQPYFTKLGGVPHRESERPWPKDKQGKPYTFVAQFCFSDSKEIISTVIPDDVMLIFFEGPDSYFEPEEIHIEWSSVDLNSPITAEQCPKPSFVVPQLSAHLYRTNEYPESWDVFEQAGHNQSYLFPVTQASKIGRETFYIQNDAREEGEDLLCTLNSLHPTNSNWPFYRHEKTP